MLQREVFRTQRRALHKPPSRTTSWRTASTVCGTGGEGDDVNGDAPAGPVGDLGPVGDAPAGPVGDAPAGPGGDDAVVPAGTIASARPRSASPASRPGPSLLEHFVLFASALPLYSSLQWPL